MLAATLLFIPATFTQQPPKEASQVPHINVAVLVAPPHVPDYDKEVLSPLRIKQAAKAQADALEAAERARREREAQVATPAPSAAPAAPARVVAPSGGDVAGQIIKWANVYGVDAGWLLQVARCESGLNQNATNYGYSAGGGHPHGIFQFLPQTFYGNGGNDYESSDDQARVAAHMFSRGQSSQWECK